MILFDHSLRTGYASLLSRFPHPLWCALALAMAWTPAANAGFVGYYSVSNFSLINTNADGLMYTPDAGLTMSLVGGNNGSGLEGTTDWIILAAALGAVRFDYSYSSVDGPGFDSAGYLLGSTFVQLADTDGASGSLTISVTPGQSIGFRVETADNMGEPGIMTVSNFDVVENASATPEPATSFTLSVGCALIWAALLMKKRWTRVREAVTEKHI